MGNFQWIARGAQDNKSRTERILIGRLNTDRRNALVEDDRK